MQHDDSNKPRSLVEKFAERYGVEADRLLSTLKATAFKQRDGSAPSNEQMMALMVVADQYGLNPFTREIYAFPDKQNGIVPVVGVDGWSRIINNHPQFNGMDFGYSEGKVLPDGAKSECHEWVECTIYRKDREHPTKIREYLDEVYRPPVRKTGSNGPYTIEGPWQTHPKRFLRHKATIQCARLAFGFVGIYDQDEAERIAERDMGHAEVVETARPALEYYPAEDFVRNLPAWRKAIDAGTRTAEQIIAMVQTKGILSDEQKATILADEQKATILAETESATGFTADNEEEQGE